jgi:hypothetical protein
LAGFSPSAAAALLAALLSPFPSVAAQRPEPAGTRVAGRIVRVVAGDTLPVRGPAVVLHRVSRRAQGPLDTVATTAGGRFAFRLRPDSATTYLVSVRWAGIEYFSAALSADSRRPDTALVIVVADTASGAPVRVRQRTLLVGAPDEAGFRAVLDWFALANASGLTRVASDSGQPVWVAPLPPGAEGAGLADSRLSEFSPDAVLFERDSVSVWAPISPGERELLLQYRLPPDLTALRVPLGGGADSLQLFLEETSARVRGGSLTPGGTQTIEQRAFRLWSGRGAPGAQVEVAFANPVLTPGQMIAALVGVATLAFAVLAVVLLRRGRAAPAAAPLSLADRIARLDLEYAGREGDVSPEEWRGYQETRARLRAELARALAGRPHRS